MYKLINLLFFIAYSIHSLGQQSRTLELNLNLDVSLIDSQEVVVGDTGLVFTEISDKDFQEYLSGYKINCSIDSGKFVEGSGIYVKNICDETCTTFLYEYATINRITLPSDYDSGIAGMLFSPSCNQFLIYSSYDGPDYDNYYDHRAEIFIFNIAHGKGLNGIQQSFEYFTKSWSIENLIWVNEKTIALKIYEEEKQGDDTKNKFKYFLTDILK
jgi:hypothetical protein